MFSTTVHGQGFFYYSVNLAGGSNGSFWGTHFIPTLLLLVPFYAIAPSPITLLVLKQAALALAAIPIYGIAKVYFEKEAVPVIFAALYLVSPLTLGLDWNSFDPEAFLPITFLAALYFFTKGRFWPFLVCWMLALGTIEGAPPLLILFAIGGLLGTLFVPSMSPYWTRLQERRVLLIALGVAVVWLGVAYLVLEAVGGRGGAFGSSYAIRYTVLGATSFPDVIPQALTHPGNAAAALQFGGSKKILYLEIIIFATGAVSLLGGLRYLLPLAGFLTLAFLSNNAGLYSLGIEYTGLIIGFLFASAIEGTVLVSDLVRGAPSGQRRRDLERRLLRGGARELLNLVETRDYDPALRSRALGLLQRATTDLANGELGPAEAKLLRLRRLAETTPSSAPVVPPAAYGSRPPVGPDESAARSSTEPRSGFLPRGAEGWSLLPVAVLAIAILATTAVSNPFVEQPAGGATSVAWGYLGTDPHDEVLDSVLQLIPPEAPVLTTSHLFTALSDRPDVYMANNGLFLKGNESYAQDLNDWAIKSNYIAIDYVVDPLNAVILRNDTNNTLMTDFGLYAAAGGASLYERGYLGPPSVWAPLTTAVAGGQMVPRDGVVTGQFGTSLGPSFYHPPGGSNGGGIWGGPSLLFLPHGFYNATFNLELLAPNAGPQLSLRVLDYPAVITDHVTLNSSTDRYHTVVVSSGSNDHLLAETAVDTTSSSSTLNQTSVTLPFVWDSSGYLDFPGFELSTSMSVYLVSVQIVESSALR